MPALGMRHAALEAEDVERATRFFTERLGFETYSSADPENPDWAMVKLAGTTVSFVRVRKREGAPADPLASAGHHAAHLGLLYETPTEVDALRARLSGAGVETGPCRQHRDGSYGFYFRDSEGNLLEAIVIPA